MWRWGESPSELGNFPSRGVRVAADQRAEVMVVSLLCVTSGLHLRGVASIGPRPLRSFQFGRGIIYRVRLGQLTARAVARSGLRVSPSGSILPPTDRSNCRLMGLAIRQAAFFVRNDCKLQIVPPAL